MWEVIQGGEQMSTFCLVITSAYCSRFFLLQRKESAHVFMFFSLKHTHWGRTGRRGRPFVSSPRFGEAACGQGIPGTPSQEAKGSGVNVGVGTR